MINLSLLSAPYYYLHLTRTLKLKDGALKNERENPAVKLI